jgi:serine phosphatase RsbU (regulator of sigma subunit)
VSAGHPPPLLRRPGGTVARLPEATHAPLGVGDGTGRPVEVAFPPGSCVLGYTDGLVERRGEAIDVGISRLADVFASTNGSVWGTVSAVLRAMTPAAEDRGGDDVAVVVAQHRSPT